MKNIFLNLSIFTLLAITFSSCSEEIQPSTDGKSTAIIFATLNERDTIHFVKITKAFYGGGNSLELAQIPDSSYFKKVEATIKEFVGGSVTRTFVLKDTIIQNKETNGAFYAPEQKMYYFKTTAGNPLINDGAVYKLNAIINDGELEVTGETSLVGQMTISAPTPNSQFSFAQTNVAQYGYAATNIGFNTGSAKRIEVKLIVEFDEFIGSTIAYTKSFDWSLANIDADDIKANTASSASASGKTFYELIKSNATNDNQISRRVLKGIRVLVNGASNDLQKYLIVNQPSSSLAQNKPSYTNLTVSNGHRVIGVFASRYFVDIYKPKVSTFGGIPLGCLNNPSMKELCNGTITGSLKFCSDNPGDLNQTYFCN